MTVTVIENTTFMMSFMTVPVIEFYCACLWCCCDARSQDRIAENQTFVFASTKVTCYSHVAEVRSVQEGKFGVPKTTALRLTAKANQVRDEEVH